jgi:hypothetical protein
MFAGRKAVTRLDRANGFSLPDRPITSALLSRAARYQDEAIRDLREIGGSPKISDEKSLITFAASAASTIAYHVAVEAAKSQGRNPAFLPYETVPKYAPMVVAFSLFILAGIDGHLKAEGLDIRFPETAASTANLFFLGHPSDERVAHASRGIAAFQAIGKQDAENVRAWHDNLMKIVPIYVLQWSSDKEEMRKLDFNSLFGSMLAGLLKAVE